MSAMNKKNGTTLPTIAVLIAAALWGSFWIPLRQITETGISGAWATILVYGGPLVLMLPIVAFRGKRAGSFGWGALWVGAASGICNTFYGMGFIEGEVSKVMLLFYLNPIWAALLERTILKTPIVRSRQLTILLGFLGMAVLVSGNGSVLPLPRNISEWFGVIAGFFWALSMVGMRYSGEGDIIPKSCYQFLFGLVGCGIILFSGLFPGELWPQPGQLAAAMPWTVITVFLWIFPTMVLAFWGISFMSPSKASILFMLEAIVGVVSAAIFTDEPFGWREIVGGLLILSAALFDILFTGGDPDTANGDCKLKAAE
ncbi:DMT family transporter [Dongia soli]|uniref:DMT family transporter n=1 Tax=Dongia soli TaxID=600628 RepID=A0ABU5E9H7_9PROT|nr:DMT family transporter [Dongia soli]MDY0882932.1 DMT family transporter [Dongia soli]